MTLRDVYNDFMKDQLLKGNTEKTIKYYRTHLKLFFDYIPDFTHVENLRLEDLNNYKLYLLGSKLHRPTVRTYCGAVRTFAYHIVNNGLSKEDLKSFTLPKPNKRLFNVLTLDQIKQINDSFDLKAPCGFRNKCIFNLFLDSGIRREELITLDKNKLFDNHFIVYGKGRKERIVTYGIGTRNMIQQYLEEYRPFGFENIDILFLNRNGTPITEDTIKRMFTDLRNKTKIKTLYPHQLRHTFATYFLINGGDSFTLQMLLGHTTLDITQRYVHLANTIKITMMPNNNSLIDKLGRS